LGASVAAASVLVYFISGLAKFLGNSRWDGSNPWRSLIRPPSNLVPPDRGCILVMHAAIGLMMGLFLFALVMIVMNLAAFGVPSTGRRAQGTSATTKQ